MPEDTDSGVDEVGEIVARLRQEVRAQGGGSLHGDGLGHEALPSRWHANAFAGVTADRPYESLPGLYGRIRGVVLVPLKAVLRRLMRWYVEPALVQQRSFNAAILRVVDELTERQAADVRRLERRLEELEERVGRSEPPRP
ncbi:MAG: hypothetical protein M3P42_04115 [Actinomycetota bacterium]|nr:hypothetical protein [Actinomycetota bacterium]